MSIDKDLYRSSDQFLNSYLDNAALKPVLSIHLATLFFVVSTHYINLVFLPYILYYFLKLISLLEIINNRFFYILITDLSLEIILIQFILFFFIFL
jgi:hypothetical protein